MRIWIVALADMRRDLGAAAHLRAQVVGLRRRGHEVVAFLSGPPPADASCEPDTVWVPRPALPTPRLRFASQALSFQLGLVPRMLAQRARRGRPDVLLARQDAGLGAAVAAARALGVPVVSEINGCLRYELAAAGHGPAAIAAAERLERWGYARSRRVIAVSDGLADHLVRDLGVDPRRVRVCPNGTDVEAIASGDGRALRRRAGAGPGAVVIGYLGGLQRHQGVAELVEAFGRLAAREPALRLLVVGEGEGHAALRRRLASVPWGPRVTLLGAVRRSEVPDCLAAMDVCAALRFHPRPGAPGQPAGSPLKIFDYLAAGRPVVAGPLPDLRFVEKIGAGACVDPMDTEAVVEALAAPARDAALRERQGRAGRDWARRHASWGRALERVESVLDEAVAG